MVETEKMIKIKIKLNYRSSKLRVAAITILSTLLTVVLFIILSGICLWRRWGFTYLESLSVDIDTKDLKQPKIQLRGKFDHRAPVEVDVSKVFGFFMTDKPHDDLTRKPPKNFAVVFGKLNKTVKPGSLEIYSKGTVNLIDEDALGFLTQSLVEGKPRPVTYFIVLEVFYNCFLGLKIRFIYYKIIQPYLTKSTPAIFFRIEKVLPGSSEIVLDTSRTNLNGNPDSIFTKISGKDLYNILNENLKIKLLVLFKFWHFRGRLNDLEIEIELAKGKGLMKTVRYTKRERRKLNADSSLLDYWKHFPNFVIKSIDVTPIKGTSTYQYSPGEAFNCRLLLELEYDQEQEKKKKIKDRINFYKCLQFVVQNYIFNTNQSVYCYMLKFFGTELINKLSTVDNYYDEDLAELLRKFGSLNIAVEPPSKEFTAYMNSLKNRVDESLWDVDYNSNN